MWIEGNYNLNEFVGQEAIVSDLALKLRQARMHITHLPHMLICADAEMGKTLLVKMIANELQAKIFSYDVSKLFEDVPTFTGILTSLGEGCFFHMDRIEALKEPYLGLILTILKHGYFDVMIENQPCRIPTKPFTLIGTTSQPLRVDDRLHMRMMAYEFVPYDLPEISEIAQVVARRIGLELSSEAAEVIANQARGVPGYAALLVRKVSDYCRIMTQKCATVEVAQQALEVVGANDQFRYSYDLARELRHMDGQEFEKFVAKLFRSMQYSVELRGGPGDHGVDLLVRGKGKHIAIQCKAWDQTVGEPTLRDFSAALADCGAKQGIVFSTSDFSYPARVYAKNKPIKLVGLDILVRFLRSYPGIKP